MQNVNRLIIEQNRTECIMALPSHVQGLEMITFMLPSWTNFVIN